jgi:hypothetical protein
VPAVGAAAAAAPWPAAGVPGVSGAVGQLHGGSELTGPAAVEAAGTRAVQGSALRLSEVGPIGQAGAGDKAAQVQGHDTNTGAQTANGLVAGLAGVAAAPAATSAFLNDVASAATDRGPVDVASGTPVPAGAAAGGPRSAAPQPLSINREAAVKREAADAAAEQQGPLEQGQNTFKPGATQD